MRDNKRGTVEDPSTDRLLYLAFEQEKHELLLTEPTASQRIRLLREAQPWPTPGTVEEAEFGPAVDPLNDILRDMNYGGERALTAAITAVEAAAEAGLLRTVEECLSTFRRIRDGLAVHES